MKILRELKSAYLYWRLVRKIQSLPDPKLAHQDDATDEELQQAIAFRREGKPFLFAGDLPEGHPMLNMARTFVRISVRVRNASLLGGMCHDCGALHMHWPASGREMLISGWSYRDDGGPRMGLLCPACTLVESQTLQRSSNADD